MNRRHLLKNLSLMALAPIAGAGYETQNLPTPTDMPLSETPAFESIEELAKGVFFAKGKVKYFENGNVQEIECNNGWVLFDDFVLVIDANFPAKAAMLVQEIRKTTNKPIRYIFNTHHHGDHLYGNSVWARQGAVPIAHIGVINELRRVETGYYENKPGRWENMAKKRTDLQENKLLPPIITFTDTLVIEDKTRRVELRHLGAGHTRGDGVAWLPNEKILFAGDSCQNGPYNLMMDAEVSSWITTLDKMHRLQPSILVTGHGPLGSSNTPMHQQAYFKLVYEWVRQKKAETASLEALKKQLPELRSMIQQHEHAKTYLIPEPSVVTVFSLEAHVQKIFES